MTTLHNCTVCGHPAICDRRNLITTTTEQGDWATAPFVSKTRCKVEDDRPAAFLYEVLLGLAARQGVAVSELLDGTDGADGISEGAP